MQLWREEGLCCFRRMGRGLVTCYKSELEGGGGGEVPARTKGPVGEVGEGSLGAAQVRVGHLDGCERVDGGFGFYAVALVYLLLAVGARGRRA